MIILKYIVNLSVFSTFVIIPLVIHSFFNYIPVKKVRRWAGLYAVLFIVILVLLSINQLGYSFDLRIAIVIVAFSYLGPVTGLVTGYVALVARLYENDIWFGSIYAWTLLMVGFLAINFYFSKLTTIKRVLILFCTYACSYLVIESIFYNIKEHPFIHFEYLLFVCLGVIIAILIIESYLRLYELNSKLEYMYKKVGKSELKYRLIVENTVDMTVVLNKSMSLLYYSPSHLVILGYEESELEGIKFQSLIHPDDYSNFRDMLNVMFQNKKAQSVIFRIQNKKGEWIELESSLMPVKREDESIEHIVVNSRDISERRKVEESLLQSEKLSIVSELAAGVAHEIRNPLTTIKGFVQLYKKENKSVVYSDLLLNELDRIEEITSELLTLGKPQSFKRHIINVQELMENTLELLTLQLGNNAIQFKLNVEHSSIMIACEKNQLKQVFLNVLKNAVESMEAGGEININISQTSCSECIISIRDQGCGIPEDLLPRLGEPFYSLKDKGTGLGLMVCHKIIEQHNGKITYSSKVNEGTLIEIILPLVS
ncbi:ATP-binding protein [Gottfriedia acidiceleris]|uniref:histidine kinase n=1 Tax=Gottfriedia acidiceleris TaxID=371036 RepID=A0ABY4JN01_9BACI|nr:ATP-binding protein [Gottfriedia acidiceleris]UPM55219.1 ATP-binding protein [Gottfriedia acidiceleris]